MLIPIITSCKEPDSVPSYVLDRMLACGEVHAFERSTGWVVVGRDPIRAARRGAYQGHERRRSVSFQMQSFAA
ncbi:MAG: hypothetical protein A2076_05135 [Geobacteraceae bacterium GWC2_53_11]|nr:MAG: hypothetical protein A2076_05135 [Geobacteraceae bacterium GWC2_53_11]